MKVSIHAVGRMKAGPDSELAERYIDRFAKSAPGLGLDFSGVTEIAESRLAQSPDRQREEAAHLLSMSGPTGALILLDERGLNLTSPEFATRLGRMRDDGVKLAVFAIGGPDGHAAALREKAALVWSFGSLTWPHQIARIMLAEQLYRATTILSGHPYHRA